MKTFASGLLIATFLFSSYFSLGQEHRYVFNQNLNEVGTGPALTEAIGTNCGATAGSFLQNQTIKTTAGTCSGTSNVFSFTAGGGLSYPNSTGFIQSSYTIHTFFQFNDYSTGYARIIDFSNGASDNGIYTLNSCLNFYPSGSVGTCPYFVNGNYYLISLVRDGATNQMKAYVNGVLFTTYTDVNNYYKPATTTTPIIFFRDDNVVTCEVEPGMARYISLSPAVSSDAQVANLWNNICSAITTLPVNLTSFVASKNNEDNIKLTWSTANEKNTKDFIIERSTDGRNFTSIGRVNSINTPGNNTYSFNDNKPLVGNNFYRLKQVDLDSKHTYSAIRQINIIRSGKFNHITYNPFDKKVYISSSANWLTGSATIFSAGSQVLKKVIIRGSLETIDISNLPIGTYYIRLQKGQDIVTDKVIKL